MKCDICKNEKECKDWNYIIKKNVRGKIQKFTPGTDTVYKVGGREVGREQNKTYFTGEKSIVVDRGTAYICKKCRIIWSTVVILAISTLLSLIFTLIFLPKDTTFISYFSEFMMYLIPIFAVISLTPIMKHIILGIKISREKKVLPWKVLSKFWE